MKQKNKDKNILVIVLLAFLLLTISVAGYFFLQIHQLRSQAQNSIPTVTADETINWKTYSDPNGYFQLKHPPQFHEKTSFFTEQIPLLKDAGILYTSSVPFNFQDKDDINLQFVIATKKPEENLQTFLARINNKPLLIYSGLGISYSKIIINNKDGYWLDNVGGGVSHIEAYAPIDNDRTWFQVIATDNYASITGKLSQNHIDLIRKILSTVKFQ